MNNNELKQYVDIKEKCVVTTSRLVAERFNKEHKNVLNTIRGILSEVVESTDEFSRLNFKLATYLDTQAKPRVEYILDKKAFMLLAMRFTGPEALKVQISFVDAFEKMAEMLAANAAPKTKGEALLASVQMMLELERRQEEQAREFNKIDTRLVDIETRVLGSHHGQPMSALAYLRNKGRPHDGPTVLKFGMKASRLAKDLGVVSYRIPDSRFGSVNGYYEDFYDQVASQFFVNQELTV